jgi:membrane protease YdiL (CAAX protease family)
MGEERGAACSPWPLPTARSLSWTIRYAVIAFVCATAGATALYLLLRAVGVGVPRSDGTLLGDATMLAALVPLARRDGLSPKDLGLRRAPGARSVGLVLLAIVAYGWVGAVWLRTTRPGPSPDPFAGVWHQSTIVIALSGVAACVVAPVMEEVFFRGLLYRSLRNRMDVPWACLLAAAMFGAIHFQYGWADKVDVALFGVTACLLYEYTGSLLPGIAMHSLIDGAGFESSLTGRATLVVSFYALLAAGLLLHAAALRIARRAPRRAAATPAKRDRSPA